MSMKKQERKEGYAQIISHLIKGENKEAFQKVVEMYADDTSVFVLCDYDKSVEEYKNKTTEK